MLRVAVVGAGAAGLCAAKHILSSPSSFAPPVVFEATGGVGGTWCYTEHVHEDGRPVFSSMYRDLRTNLPKEVMMFPDFPFASHLSSFLPHQEVLRYLENYCQNHGVQPHIRFNTLVERVKPVAMTTEAVREKTVWEVTSSDASGRRRVETFDAVLVCSGHYSDPHIPDLPGIRHFKGQLLHSHSYRYAEPFSGQSVVVLGAKASGLDISIELAKAGARVLLWFGFSAEMHGVHELSCWVCHSSVQVTLSHGYPRFSFPLPAGIQQASSVVAVQDDGSLLFQDGSLGRADVLMFCTGYNFRYPFLDAAQLGLEVEDHLVTPLYRFMVPPAFPSLFFIGICKIICPFPNFNCQVQFALAVLDGSISLPSRTQMEDEVRGDLQRKLDRGVQRRHLLKMDQDQWQYCEGLARSAGFPPLPPVVRSLYEEVWRQRQIHPENYRKLNYRLVSDTQWEVVN
ncbi:Flavin-containing monooxygenase FMO GS-OX-like 3 [Oryzias melastigma]|uniref:Flavin-containing monooxygenase n=1 Tax=Oryzias melastigma TaxID=30732 RepID=A0A834FSX6_ORYME|nr:Flavin-containing monooxygenase FMO GS-OX-like 3 [Oryzias melastigma]